MLFGLVFSLYKKRKKKAQKQNVPPHPPVNKWDLYSIKEGPWWSSSVVYPAAKLTDGAGFPPFAVQTRVKFWAWYRLNGAGVFSATTDMLLGGAVDTETQSQASVGTSDGNMQRLFLEVQFR